MILIYIFYFLTGLGCAIVGHSETDDDSFEERHGDGILKFIIMLLIFFLWPVLLGIIIGKNIFTKA